jgi:hypothetical protein
MAVNRSASYPMSGDTPISAFTGAMADDTRYYQAFYRNSAAGWCNPATFNITSGYVITWSR